MEIENWHGIKIEMNAGKRDDFMWAAVQVDCRHISKFEATTVSSVVVFAGGTYGLETYLRGFSIESRFAGFRD